MKTIFTFCVIVICCFNINGQTTLFNTGSTWKYNDLGLNLGTNWILPSYNDASWQSGQSELGYGDGDEQTVVSYGSNSSNKHTTTYFRKTFFVSNPTQYQEIIGSIRRDDGAVVYVNGTEVFRSNMPNGSISYSTFAPSTISFGGEDSYENFAFSPGLLINGNNTIAVEIHQDEPSSSDISFNMSMLGSTNPQVIQVSREPYLNTGTSNSIVIRWQTDVPTDSKVNYGTSLASMSSSVSVYPYSTEHEVKITGLNPNTKYYYTIGSTSIVLSGASLDQYFKTSPVIGESGTYRFWTIGDAGMSNANQEAVRDGFYIYNQNKHIDGWLLLGDNAYGNGLNDGNQANYQTAYFDNMYSPIISNTVCWPALGNHDYNNHIPFSPSPAYFDIFHLPTNAEAGGVPSGTEKYYSYNYGNVHFIVLDSYDEDRSQNSPMATWLLNDLQANSLDWVIAYWHHPPYTKGSHDSDNSNLLDGECVDMRENFLPILEEYGVDLVLNGHSHSYERSFLIDSHYGSSGTLTQTMILDEGSGGNEGDCPYRKNTTYSKSHKGTVYSVVGCSGKLSSISSSWPHPIMSSYDYQTLGSMVFTVNENKLEADFINTLGEVMDHFSIVKNAGISDTLTTCPNESLTLTPSFPGVANWFPTNISSDSLVITPSFSTMYIASDSLNCIKDRFFIEVLAVSDCFNSTEELKEDGSSAIASILWNPNEFDLSLFYSGFNSNTIQIEVYTMLGQKLYEKEFENGFQQNNTVNFQTNVTLKGPLLIKISDQKSTIILKQIR
ncbi:MAG: purple acid phosphatase family protein [Fluviicola sp.]